VSRFLSHRSPEQEAELPDLEPGSRRLSGGARATLRERRPTDPTRRALAEASGALTSAIDRLRRALPNEDSIRAKLVEVDRTLGRARLAEDYARVAALIDAVEVPDPVVHAVTDDALELFHRFVFALTPMARAADLPGPSADLADLSRVAELTGIDGLEVRRALRVIETLTAYVARSADGLRLTKRYLAEIFETLSRLFDGEAELRRLLESFRDRLDHAREPEDFERLRAELQQELDAILDATIEQGAGLESARERARDRHDQVEQLENALRTAHDEARTDPLTGLQNRRALSELVEGAATVGPIGLLLLDLDHFKSVNDQHGHAVGDAVLVAVAEMLRGALRGDDRAFRVGGEELAILLPGADFQGARATAERLRERLAATRIPIGPGGALSVTASIGLSVWSTERSFDEACAAADAALYRAKAGGRNRVVG